MLSNQSCLNTALLLLFAAAHPAAALAAPQLSSAPAPPPSPAAAAAAESAARGFLPASYHSATGQTMRYRLFVPPAYDPAKKYPIVLWLHDAAGRGSDNLAQISASNLLGSHLFSKPAAQAQYHAFILAPQISYTKSWARPHTNTPPLSIRLALEILDTIEKKYSLDRTREYIVGQSIGAEGVWRALSIAPTRFAAAIALCGYGDAWMIPRVAKVPVWIFQGAADPLIAVERARAWVAALRQAGGAPKYSEYPDIGHNVWDVAFSEPDLLPWLFSHRAESQQQPPPQQQPHPQSQPQPQPLSR